ncbi:MAG: hypothetical protein MJ068_03120 [Clostridia bacterium]|nr:hypothetical protein [Clostridia bacterium]
MSVILGYVKEDTVYLATDTRIIEDNSKYTETAPLSYKLRKLDNGIIYGVSTTNLLIRQCVNLNAASIFQLNKKRTLDIKYVIKRIVGELEFFLENNGFVKKEDNDSKSWNGDMIIAYKNKLFIIYCDFSVDEISEYTVAGYNLDFYKNAISNINPDEDINGQLTDILSSAHKHIYTVAPPYLLINTKDMKHHLVDEPLTMQTCDSEGQK